MMLGLEIDYFDIQCNWSNGVFQSDHDEEQRALGQAQYIAYNRHAIVSFKGGRVE